MRLGLPNDGTVEPRHDRSARPTTSSPRASASASTASSRSSPAAATPRPPRKTLATLPDVAAVSPAQAIPGKNLALISVTPSSGPSSEATENLVKTIRDTRFDSEVLVTGQTATNIDVSQRWPTA